MPYGVLKFSTHQNGASDKAMHPDSAMVSAIFPCETIHRFQFKNLFMHADCTTLARRLLIYISTPFANYDLGAFEENEHTIFRTPPNINKEGEFMNWLIYGLVWIIGSMGIACLFGRMVQDEVLKYFRR